jgi:hypothetical protein
MKGWFNGKLTFAPPVRLPTFEHGPDASYLTDCG